MQFSSYATLGEHIKAGKRATRGQHSQALPSLPDLPTIAEAALPGYESSQWFGLLRAPHPAHDRRPTQSGNEPVFGHARRERAASGACAEIRGSTPEEFSTLLKLETAKWAKVIATAGIKPQ